MERAAGLKAFYRRRRAGCLANLGLKLVALVIAIVIYVLVHRNAGEPEPEPGDAVEHAP
jgi:hypothetical protein